MSAYSRSARLNVLRAEAIAAAVQENLEGNDGPAPAEAVAAATLEVTETLAMIGVQNAVELSLVTQVDYASGRRRNLLVAAAEALAAVEMFGSAVDGGVPVWSVTAMSRETAIEMIVGRIDEGLDPIAAVLIVANRAEIILPPISALREAR